MVEKGFNKFGTDNKVEFLQLPTLIILFLDYLLF